MPHMENNNPILKIKIDTFNNSTFILLALVYEVRNMSCC